MQKYSILLIVIPILLGCTNNNFSNNNPYIPNYNFTVEIDLGNASNSQLSSFPNALYYPYEGVRGIFIICSGIEEYKSFDAACPNQALSSCSTMSFKKINPVDPLKIDKTTVVCSCDNAEYSLFTGQSPGKQYPLKQYRVEVNGSLLRVYN